MSYRALDAPIDVLARHLTKATLTTWLILIVNALLVVILLNALRQKILPRNASHPPIVFHWFPIIGSAIWYGNDPIAFFQTCQERYGNVFTFILLGRKVTVALTPKGSNFVLGGKSTAFNAEEAYKLLGVVYDVPNEIFMQQKKFVKSGFSTENLRAYVGMVEEEVAEFVKTDRRFRTPGLTSADEWGSFDAVGAMAEITILTAARTLQGKEVRDNMDKSFSQLYADLDGGFTPLNFLFPNLPLPSYRKRDAAQKKMSEFYIDIMTKRKENPDDNHHYDMIASATLAWTSFTLPLAPMNTVYEEQVERFSNPDGTLRPIGYDDLCSLPVLDSCLRETLRMHPPIHSIMRQVREDVPVPPTLAAPSEDEIYIIPKGTYVLASPLILQIDPGIWDDAKKWNPARWNDEYGIATQGSSVVSKGTESPYKPFGAGKHRCIGEQVMFCHP
ncbi:cytochrome P450 [Mycena metata]|uniref:Cytochrome P450 n=1 Tax=Mycena metata TaxID=1033252 RepID=A0AAD7MIH7_9AGAR|nr:cytochrome P450 [Mycena metata]